MSDNIHEKCEEKIINFVHDWGKTRNIKLICTGNFLRIYEPSATFGIWVADFSPESMESGKTLAVKLVNDFWAYVQKTPECVQCYENYCKESPRFHWGKMGLKDVCVRIAFWDKDVNRPLPPKLAEITFFNEKFHYYQADPKTLALQLVLEESYEQANPSVKKN